MYCPLLFVVAVREFPVALSVNVTAASGTTAPVLSVTVPEIVPVLELCASVALGAIVNRQKSAANRTAKKPTDTPLEFLEEANILEHLSVVIFSI